jgi:hypothetical protein
MDDGVRHVHAAQRNFDNREKQRKQICGRAARLDPIILDGLSHTVIGVVPADFQFPDDNAIWVPVPFTPGEEGNAVFIVARLNAGTSLRQAEADDHVSGNQAAFFLAA